MRRKNRYLFYYFRYSVTKISNSGELLFILQKKKRPFLQADISFYEENLGSKARKQGFKTKTKSPLL